MNVVPMCCPGGAPMAEQEMGFEQAVLGARRSQIPELGYIPEGFAGHQSTLVQCASLSSWAEGQEVEKASDLLKS